RCTAQCAPLLLHAHHRYRRLRRDTRRGAAQVYVEHDIAHDESPYVAGGLQDLLGSVQGQAVHSICGTEFDQPWLHQPNWIEKATAQVAACKAACALTMELNARSCRRRRNEIP